MKKRILPLMMILLGLAGTGHAQKSRVLAVFQMIDQEKFTEAKEAIELATWNVKTSRWHRTYYAKGLLCQTAWEKGYPKEKKLMELYPDQLYLAYDAYEKAIELDVRKRHVNLVAQKYYHLSNDFRKLGSDHFKRSEYEKALRAFEHALDVNNSELVKAPIDTSLVYNTALAAFEAGNWERSVHYLTELHDAAHDPATTLLLFRACESMQDSIRAEEVLMEALDIYDYDRQVVVYLVNLLASTDRYDLAIDILDQAIGKHPEEDQFHWGKGLIYRRLGNREEAIESFKKAIDLNPEEAKLYYHVGVIYYNMGVDLRKASLRVIDSQEYLELKARSLEKFRESVRWMEQSYALDPYDEQSIQRLRQLYNELQMKDKEASMQRLLQ